MSGGKEGDNRQWHDVEKHPHLLHNVLATAARETKQSEVPALPSFPGFPVQLMVPGAAEREINGMALREGKHYSNTAR